VEVVDQINRLPSTVNQTLSNLDSAARFVHRHFARPFANYLFRNSSSSSSSRPRSSYLSTHPFYSNMSSIPYWRNVGAWPKRYQTMFRKRYRSYGSFVRPTSYRRNRGYGYHKYRRRHYDAISANKMLIAETKIADFILDNGAGSTAPIAYNISWTSCELNPATVLCYNGIAQGSARNERVSNKITLVSFSFKMNVSFVGQVNKNTRPYTNTCKVSWILMRHPHGAEISSENVYENQAGIVDTICIPNRVVNYAKEYKVLATRNFVNNDSNSGFAIGPIASNLVQGDHDYLWSKFKKMKGLPMSYDGSGGTVAATADNAIFCIANSNASSTWRASAHVRLVYYG